LRRDGAHGSANTEERNDKLHDTNIQETTMQTTRARSTAPDEVDETTRTGIYKREKRSARPDEGQAMTTYINRTSEETDIRGNGIDERNRESRWMLKMRELERNP